MSAAFLAVWCNGALRSDAAIAVHAGDRGLTLGDGLFETIAVFNGHAVWLGEHLDRLIAGAATIGLAVARETIEAAVKACLIKAGRVHGILRITLTRGAGGRGLGAAGGAPTLIVTLAPWPGGMIFRAARLVTARVRRNEHSPTSRIKSLSYLDNILAVREAEAAGADDALMLNGAGRVACASIANVFLIEDGRLVTPPAAEGVLAGIARRMVMEAARDLGLGVAETPIAPSRIMTAQGLFLTNSLRLIRPVTALDGVPLGSVPRELMERLRERLCAGIARDCGADPRAIDRA